MVVSYPGQLARQLPHLCPLCMLMEHGVVLAEESRDHERDATSASCLQARQTITTGCCPFQAGSGQFTDIRQRSQRTVPTRGVRV